MQMGYNLLYGLYKASYDADCSLFLGVLRGDVKEDVYIQTAQLQVRSTLQPFDQMEVFAKCTARSISLSGPASVLQDELVELFASMDKAKGGVESGFVSKVRVHPAGMPQFFSLEYVCMRHGCLQCCRSLARQPAW
jgi:hypothetical protein